MSLVIGVLMPTSMMFPGVDQALLAGLEGAVADLSPPPRFVIEPIGAGAQREIVSSKVQRLLLVERPHVVVGVLGAGVVPHVRALFDQHRTPFIVCNLGADLLPNNGTPQQFVFWNSLNLWQSMYALGCWAASNAGSSVAVAAAYHEAGFGIVDAFYRGFLGDGGRIAAIEVTHRESATQDPSDAIARLAAFGADFMFGLYSGREGVSFMQAFAAAGLAGRLPLVTTPLLTHGHWAAGMPGAVLGSKTACSWVPGTHPAEDAKFLAASAGRGARPAPDVFGLLAYEAGLMIAAGLAKMDGAPPAGEALAAAMADVEFTSPRGSMRVDPETREVATADHLIEVVADAAGVPAWRALDVLPLPERYQADAAEQRGLERKTGWLNAYLVN